MLNYKRKCLIHKLYSKEINNLLGVKLTNGRLVRLVLSFFLQQSTCTTTARADNRFILQCT